VRVSTKPSDYKCEARGFQAASRNVSYILNGIASIYEWIDYSSNRWQSRAQPGGSKVKVKKKKKGLNF